jgi:ADP-heptose:LPS heptosyltransferase
MLWRQFKEHEVIVANFLVLVSDRIGDAIFCTPAVELLKQRREQNLIIVIAPNEVVAEIWVNNPVVSRVLVNPTPAELSAVLTKEDVVVDLHNNKFTRKLVKRIKLSTLTSPRTGDAHQSAVALQFIESNFPGTEPFDDYEYRLFPGDDHFVLASRLLSVRPKGTTAIIGFHLGSSQIKKRSWWEFWKSADASKCWPVENFVALAQCIHTEWPNAAILLTGTPSERALAARFLAEFPKAIDLVGKTSVLTLAAVMKRITVFVTGDTGPLHVACAMRTPLVALSGNDTVPEKTGPYPPAFNRINLVGNPIGAIRVQDVMTQLRTLLNEVTINDSKHDGFFSANG